MCVFSQIYADKQFRDISDRTLDVCTARRSVKALLDAILTPQLCVRVLSAQIDLNWCDSLSGGLHPHPLTGSGFRSFLVFSPSWGIPQLCLPECCGLLDHPRTWPVTVSHLMTPGPSTGPAAVPTPLCSPASGAVGLCPVCGVTTPLVLGCPWLPHPEGAVPPLLQPDALLLRSERLKTQVHFRKVILSRYSCCLLAFIKQHLYLHFRGNLGRVFSKTDIACSPHLNQSSFLQPSSSKTCLHRGYVGCSFMSGLCHFVFALLLKRAPALLLCHTPLLPQLTSWSHRRQADQKRE